MHQHYCKATQEGRRSMPFEFVLNTSTSTITGTNPISILKDGIKALKPDSI
jgi:hypothetical protein